MKKILITITLSALMVCGAMAQSRVAPVKATKNRTVEAAQNFPGQDFFLVGLQNDPGSCSDEMQKCFGNNFILTSQNGSHKVVLAISFDYDDVPNPRGNFINKSTWSMSVSEEGNYIGTIYGDVVDGRIDWETDKIIFLGRTTTATLRVTGGLDGYSEIMENGGGSWMLSVQTKLQHNGYSEAYVTMPSN